ncbi:hypothetical protein B1R32_10960 [Abditibacterium utsteinense]|uniref:Uncharacterized protein n=1 Tax=Abditibacterium utsteinense TaxID=1960156 RepID=A0A2S8SSE3_9BACT|nr:hypothetical protein [Abditibacterium utsteinense]PQV63720.1 hypothetical protein B1R32_10960 [Abditibacterium utsteinense]
MFDLRFSGAERLLREIDGSERDDLLLSLRNEWYLEDDFWFPLTVSENEKLPPYTEAFEYFSFKQELTYETLRQILAEQQIETLYELREDGTMCEIELSEFHPIYTGLEGYWFTPQLDWLIYASHEDSITIGGKWLLPAVQAAWPDWEQHIWTWPTYG